MAALFESIAVNPQRAGKALRGELEGLHSARRGDFRVVYEILEEDRVVLIHRAAHRADVYRPR
jgi:mRNA-degrading endonuclease RelE of RelBE toxin-antitoxin system